MTVSLSLLAGAGWQFFDSNGTPLAGGLLYTYQAGTTTPLTTYTDANGNVANANPIVLDSAGRVPYQVWLTTTSSYKFILKTSTGVTVWTEDNVLASVDFASLAASSGSSLIGFIQTGTGAVARTVQSKLRDVISVKDFGAVGDGLANDTAAIQAALDAASTAGRTVYIPSGTYKITLALNVPGTVSIQGEGQASIIRPYSCHGLNFQASSVVGARKISDFWIYGDTGSNYQGIRVDLDSTAGNRITGVTFDNIYISWMGTAIYARGVWHSTFSNCYLLNTYTGILFDGQSVKNTVTDCNITRGNALVTGTGDSRGVSVRQNGAVRPEDVCVRGTLVFGFDVAIHIQNVMFMTVYGCDLDYCQKLGVEAIQVDGGFAVRDNWIAMDTASVSAQKGIEFVNLGSARRSNAVVSNNKINKGNSVAGSRGVRVGSNQLGVVVENNDVGAFDVGVYIDGANEAKILGNIINGTTSVFLFSCSDTVIANNYFANNMETFATGVVRTTYGVNSGVQTTFAVGEVSIPNGATSATVTLASLGLSPVVLGIPSRHKYMLSFNNQGSSDRGHIWGSTDGTNLTARVTTAFGITEPVQFTLQVY